MNKNLLRYKFPQLRIPFEETPEPELEERRWTVRGEARTRETFGKPHPADFKGGMPLPREYPQK